MLYAEAAARDPQNEKYRMNRDGLKPLAQLLSKAGIEKEPSREDLLASAADEAKEPLQPLDLSERNAVEELLPPPKIVLAPGTHSFHARTDERALYEMVARAYGIAVVFDPRLDPQPKVSMDLDGGRRQGGAAGSGGGDEYVFVPHFGGRDFRGERYSAEAPRV